MNATATTFQVASTPGGSTLVTAGTGTFNNVLELGSFGASSSAINLGDANTGSNAVILIGNPSLSGGVGGGAAATSIDIARDINVNNFGTVTTIGGGGASGTSVNYTSNITLNKAVTLQASAGSTVDFSNNSAYSTRGSITTGGVWTTNNNTINIGSSGNTGTVVLDSTATGLASDTGGIDVNYGTLTVNAAATGTPVSLSSSTTLNGSGIVGAVTLASSDTLNGTGTLTTGGITVNGTGDTLTGTVTGAISQSISSSLTVNGNGGSDTLAGGATLAGTGTVGAVTLAGSNTLSSTATLTTSSISVSGSGNVISAGTVGGNVTITSTGALTVTGTAGGAVTVNGGGMLLGTGTINGALSTLSSGATIAPGTVGTVGTLHVGSLGFTIGAGTDFDYDLSSSHSGSNDLISMNGGTLTIGGTGIVFDFSQTGLETGQAYTLISGASGVSGFNMSYFTASGIGGDTATFSLSGNNLVVTFAPSSSAYFNGLGADLATAGNYYTTAGGNTAIGVAPSSTTDVFLTSSNSSTTGGSVNAPTLNSNLSINSLTFTGSGTHAASGENITGSGTLTITAGTGTYTSGTGVVVQTGSGNNTIGVAVALSASQSWTVTDATNTLTVSGQISDGSPSNGYSLTKLGAGVLALTNAAGNTYSGGTTVSAGTLQVGNTSGSATGSGSVSVSGGATLAGTGTITATGSNTINIVGGSTSNRANVLVGLNSSSDASLGTKMGLNAVGGMTLNNANLTFNLSSSSVGADTQLNVGSTLLTFESGNRSTTLTLNLIGASIIPAESGYVLISGTGNTIISDGVTSGQFGGLTVSENSQGQEVIVGSGPNGTGNLAITLNGLASTYYSNSYLILVDNVNGEDSGDAIEVEVVPEPGTWAMMLGGFVMLIFIQRRRKKN